MLQTTMLPTTVSLEDRVGITAHDLDACRSRIRRYLARFWRDAHGIEDLVQEVMLRAHRKLGQLRDPESLESWLLRIAHNVAMDGHRRQPKFEANAGLEPDALPVTAPLEPPPDHVEECQDRRNHWSRCLRRALGALSPRDRTLVIAHYFVGLTCRQISERSQLSLANVKVRLHRSRTTLREHLPPEADFRAWLAHQALYADQGPVAGGVPRQAPSPAQRGLVPPRPIV